MSDSEQNHANSQSLLPGQQSVWYHVILTTYGAWLYGDARGFRTRHHREHVEGDYKNPPPVERYSATRSRSRQSLKQPPVNLPAELRSVVGLALKDRLETLGAFVLSLAVARQHVHLLAKMPEGKARHLAGKAKLHAWFVLRDRGWTSKLWGKRSKAIPIRSREQQLNVHRYILNHAQQGAWVWKWTKDTS